MTNESRWQKSSYSNNGGDCVEVAVNVVAGGGVVPVRDSKCVSGPVLGFSATAFASFLAGVRAGELGVGRALN